MNFIANTINIQSIVEKNFETSRAKEIYDRRKEVAELPFGYIKRFLDGGYFLLRGLEKVNAEASLFCTCFNLRRMMTLLGGVRPMMEKLSIKQQKEWEKTIYN